MSRSFPISDQRAGVRPIAFFLEVDGNPGDPFILPIRPEDLSRTEPSRVNVQQTLGGAWADNFGPGVQQINISGHTGWRGMDAASGLDGLGQFFTLRSMVFEQWHALRQDRINAGRDPSTVKLLFSDQLDEFCWEVVPSQFTLRRSKSRPLLATYQIAMTVIDADAEIMYAPATPTAQPDLAGAKTSLDASIQTVQALAPIMPDVMQASTISQTVAGPIGESMSQNLGGDDGGAAEVLRQRGRGDRYQYVGRVQHHGIERCAVDDFDIDWPSSSRVFVESRHNAEPDHGQPFRRADAGANGREQDGDDCVAADLPAEFHRVEATEQRPDPGHHRLRAHASVRDATAAGGTAQRDLYLGQRVRSRYLDAKHQRSVRRGGMLFDQRRAPGVSESQCEHVRRVRPDAAAAGIADTGFAQRLPDDHR